MNEMVCVLDHMSVVTVVQEVVRCADCRFYHDDRRLCFFHPSEPHTVHPRHFCARGERPSWQQR